MEDRQEMKWFDFVKISLKGIQFFAFPGIFFWGISVYLCLLAGEGFFTMQKEKAAPCVAVITAESLGQADVAKMEKMEEVTAASLVYEVSVPVQIGDFSGDLDLLGIDPSFVSEPVSSGDIFPESSGMPYIVCNGAVLKQLIHSDGTSISEEEISTKNWLNEQVILTVGDKKITAGICGILENQTERRADMGREEPVCYISKESARSLLLQSEMNPEPTAIRAELVNSGAQERVKEILQANGFMLENQDTDRIKDWEQMQLKINGWVSAAIVAGMAFVLLSRAKFREDDIRNEREYMQLQQLNLRAGNIRKKMNRIRMTAMVFMGGVAGFMIWMCCRVLSGD